MSSLGLSAVVCLFIYVPRFGKNVYVNSNSTWIDTCLITVGSRTLIGPNCSFYSGTHPTDPRVRNGTKGPENGAPITIGEDCWFGGNVTVLPGVTIGRGSTLGAGCVVTKDIPPFPLRLGIRREFWARSGKCLLTSYHLDIHSRKRSQIKLRTAFHSWTL